MYEVISVAMPFQEVLIAAHVTPFQQVTNSNP